MKEEWKKVRGFEEYAEVSNLGQIHRFERVIYFGRNHKRKRIQKETWTYGYESGDYLQASIGGVNKGVHIWVYETFNDCDVPKGLQVNHIDENKHNNCVWNLNLMTPKENTRWGTGTARMAASRRGKHYPKVAAALTNHPKKSKTVQALNSKTLEAVMEFPSTREAGRQGFDQSAVGKCCRGKRKSYKGFIWRYVDI